VQDGRRGFIALSSGVILIQVAIGLVALYEGAATIPWPSLVIRPAITLALVLTVAWLGRASALLLGWLGLLGIGYGIGVATAHSPFLALARAIALLDLAFGACWLQASLPIRKYVHRRQA
jgi:hypothetical protein